MKKNGFDFEGRFGSIERKLDSLDKSIREVKDGLTAKVDESEKDIAVIKEQLAVIHKVSGWILAPVISAIVLAILGLVMLKK